MPSLSFSGLLFDTFAMFRWKQPKTPNDWCKSFGQSIVRQGQTKEHIPLIQDETKVLLSRPLTFEVEDHTKGHKLDWEESKAYFILFYSILQLLKIIKRLYIVLHISSSGPWSHSLWSPRSGCSAGPETWCPEEYSEAPRSDLRARIEKKKPIILQ